MVASGAHPYLFSWIPAVFDGQCVSLWDANYAKKWALRVSLLKAPDQVVFYYCFNSIRKHSVSGILFGSLPA